MRFHQAFIKKDSDKEKPLGNLPSKDAATLTIPAPALTAGHYILEWIVFTHESRALRGAFNLPFPGQRPRHRLKQSGGTSIGQKRR